MKKILAASALAIGLLSNAQAADFSYTGSIANHNDVIKVGFSLLTDANDVKVWTDSYKDGVNFDPITAVWRQSGADWLLVGQNDDRSNIAAGQTRFDSGLTFSSLTAGNYLFTIATYNNWAKGTVLSAGFSFDSQTAIPLSQWCQPASHCAMGNAFSVHLSGVDTATAPVPEPETFAMLLAGLGVMAGVARRKRKTA